MRMPINEQVAHALKPCTLWTVSAGIFKGQVRESGGRVHDQLMHSSHRLMVRGQGGGAGVNIINLCVLGGLESLGHGDHVLMVIK